MKKRNRDLEFLFEIGRLRFTQRFWQRFFVTKVANDPEHIFRVAWIALLIAKKEKVKNEEKILKMALVHDIVESRTGDVDYISRMFTEQNEEEAFGDMMEGTTLEEEFIPLMKEYEKRQSIESKIVKDADNLDIDMELVEQYDSNRELCERKIKLREQVFAKLFTKTARKIFREIYSSHVHDWHFNAKRNRFNSGDFKK